MNTYLYARETGLRIPNSRLESLTFSNLKSQKYNTTYFEGHTYTVGAISIHESLIATAAQDGLKVWDFDSGKCLSEFQIEQIIDHWVHLNLNKEMLVAIGYANPDYYIYVEDLIARNELTCLKVKNVFAYKVFFNLDRVKIIGVHHIGSELFSTLISWDIKKNNQMAIDTEPLYSIDEDVINKIPGEFGSPCGFVGNNFISISKHRIYLFDLDQYRLRTGRLPLQNIGKNHLVHYASITSDLRGTLIGGKIDDIPFIFLLNNQNLKTAGAVYLFNQYRGKNIRKMEFYENFVFLIFAKTDFRQINNINADSYIIVLDLVTKKTKILRDEDSKFVRLEEVSIHNNLLFVVLSCQDLSEMQVNVWKIPSFDLLYQKVYVDIEDVRFFKDYEIITEETRLAKRFFGWPA